MTVAITDTRGSGGFGHEALLYADEPAYVDGAVEFIGEGLRADDAILVMVAPDRIATLQSALGVDADRVHFADMRSIGANPARIIPAWCDFAAQHDRHPVRGIGEPVWAERTPAELAEAQCHELLLNLAFADRPALRLLCPYDVGELDDDAIAHARSSHPCVHDRRGHRASDSYCHDVARAVLERPLPPAPADAASLVFDIGLLRDVRSLAFHRATSFGLDAARAATFVLAVDEIATNSVRYGGGSGVARCWDESGVLVCDIRDQGRIDDPLIGRRRPTPGQVCGRGLWIANQTCDLVQIRSDETGTTVRLHVRSV